MQLTKGERTRTAVVTTAYDLFVQNGYHGTSMRQIAQAADLTLGGIYNHFGNKEEIFKEVIQTFHPLVTIAPRLARLQAESVEQLLHQAATLFVEELTRHDGILNLMFIEFIELDGRHAAELIDGILHYLQPFFDRLMAEPEKLRTRSPIVLLRSMFGSLIAYYVLGDLLATTVLGQQADTADAEAVIELYLHGLVAAPEPD